MSKILQVPVIRPSQNNHMHTMCCFEHGKWCERSRYESVSLGETLGGLGSILQSGLHVLQLDGFTL